MVDSDMKFDTIVGIAEIIETTSKPGGTHSVPTPRKPNYDKQWSAGKPIQFSKTDWKAPPNMEADKKKQARDPGTQNPIHVAHFPNVKPDKINFKQYGTTIDEKKE